MLMTSTAQIQKHKEQAPSAAELCTRLLKERFGARQVIIFGSAARYEIWHENSYLDLAVEGLVPEMFFAAYTACCEQLPPCLDLDLVPLENVYPEMRARILKEVEMHKDPIQAVHTLVEDELGALELLAQELEDLTVGAS